MSTVTQAQTLLLCPFCESADTFVERADFSSCYVVCNDCGARGPTRCNEIDVDVTAEDEGAEPGEMAARRAWNTRTSSQVELLEVLEEARTCLLDGDDIFPDRACRDDTILGILNTAISNARSNSMVSGRVS